MAKLVTNRTLPIGRRWIYPWFKWLDGHCWELVSGKDFIIDPAMMKTAMYIQATQFGLKVATQWHCSKPRTWTGRLYIQAYVYGSGCARGTSESVRLVQAQVCSVILKRYLKQTGSKEIVGFSIV